MIGVVFHLNKNSKLLVSCVKKRSVLGREMTSIPSSRTSPMDKLHLNLMIRCWRAYKKCINRTEKERTKKRSPSRLFRKSGRRRPLCCSSFSIWRWWDSSFQLISWCFGGLKRCFFFRLTVGFVYVVVCSTRIGVGVASSLWGGRCSLLHSTFQLLVFQSVHESWNSPPAPTASPFVSIFLIWWLNLLPNISSSNGISREQ